MKIIRDAFANSIAVNQAALSHLEAAIQAAGAVFCAALRQGHKLIFMGNGGSAADAQHLAAEFVGRFRHDRRPWPALALHANSSTLTAIGNDYGYENIFLRPLQAFVAPGDVAIGISTSGNSPNVVAALAWARQLPVQCIGLTGQGGGAMRSYCDILLDVPSLDTPRIQECHILIGHILCEFADDYFANINSTDRVVP